MQTFLLVLYILVCFFLILVVLLQSGRGGGMGSAFGGTSQAVFGGAGAGNILTKFTAVGAALFMLLSATMAYVSSSSESALERARRDIEAREEARSGAAFGGAGDSPVDEAAPAGMSDPEAAAAEGAEGAAEGEAEAEAEGAGDAPGAEEAEVPAAEGEPAPEAEAAGDEAAPSE
jgi:preprotein translocase subunit SecG